MQSMTAQVLPLQSGLVVSAQTSCTSESPGRPPGTTAPMPPRVFPPPSAPNDPRVSCSQQQTSDPRTCPAQPTHDTLRQVSLRDHGLSSLPRLAPLFALLPASPLPPCVVYYGLFWWSPSRKKHAHRTIFYDPSETPVIRPQRFLLCSAAHIHGHGQSDSLDSLLLRFAKWRKGSSRGKISISPELMMAVPELLVLVCNTHAPAPWVSCTGRGGGGGKARKCNVQPVTARCCRGCCVERIQREDHKSAGRSNRRRWNDNCTGRTCSEEQAIPLEPA